MKTCVIVSCEHGTSFIPKAYAHAFKKASQILKSHRGLDIGILEVAKDLAVALNVSLIEATTSRLLVECNRSLNHPSLFSTWSLALSEHARETILNQYYFPYLEQVEEAVSQALGRGESVIHLSMHSFTPIFDEVERNAEIGLLFDPDVKLEDTFSRELKKNLEKASAAYRVKMNYPYLGISDGLTQTLRTKYRGKPYIGLEVELNQALTQRMDSRDKLSQIVIFAIKETIKNFKI